MKLSATIGTEDREIEVVRDGESFRIVQGGVERPVDARRLGPTSWSLILDGRVVTVDVEPGKDGELLVDIAGTVIPVKMLDARRKLLEKARAERAHVPKGPTSIASPMPGKVVKVLVAVGDVVEVGRGLVVVEAMKMENEIRAGRAGTIKAVHVKEGQPVEGQEAMLTIE